MARSKENEDRDAVDLINDTAYAIDFLQIASRLALEEEGNRTTVRQLYDCVRNRNNRADRTLPFNPGSVLAFLYMGVLFPKERYNWFDLVPDIPLPISDPSWGLSDVTVIAPKKPNPTVRYCVRRLRNALAHATPIYNVPK